jgi:hypothetical protein
MERGLNAEFGQRRDFFERFQPWRKFRLGRSKLK